MKKKTTYVLKLLLKYLLKLIEGITVGAIGAILGVAIGIPGIVDKQAGWTAEEIIRYLISVITDLISAYGHQIYQILLALLKWILKELKKLLDKLKDRAGNTQRFSRPEEIEQEFPDNTITIWDDIPIEKIDFNPPTIDLSDPVNLLTAVIGVITIFGIIIILIGTSAESRVAPRLEDVIGSPRPGYPGFPRPGDIIWPPGFPRPGDIIWTPGIWGCKGLPRPEPLPEWYNYINITRLLLTAVVILTKIDPVICITIPINDWWSFILLTLKPIFELSLIIATVFDHPAVLVNSWSADVAGTIQFGFQDPASTIMEGIYIFNVHLLLIIFSIVLLVAWTLYTIIKNFLEKEMSHSSSFHHSSIIEIVWTTIPAFILFQMSSPSFSLLYSVDEIALPDLTLKIMGYQMILELLIFTFKYSCTFINIKGLNSSVGRAKDWKSLWRQFDPVFKQELKNFMKNYLWNMFANIKNGQLSRRTFIYQTRKKICESFLKILWDEGFILGYTIDLKDSKKLKIFLKYINEKPVINSIKLISKPSRRIYWSINQIWKIDSSKNFIIFSTNKGLKSLTDCKKLKIGGEPFIVIN